MVQVSLLSTPLPTRCRHAVIAATNVPTPWPISAPATHVMGHCCQGRSQSNGIGTAPSQLPATDPSAGYTSTTSAKSRSSTFATSRRHVSELLPATHAKGTPNSALCTAAQRNVRPTRLQDGCDTTHTHARRCLDAKKGRRQQASSIRTSKQAPRRARHRRTPRAIAR